MTADGRIGVAFVIVRLGRGGAEGVLVSLANGLDAERFASHVIAIRDAGELAGELADHVAVHTLDRRRPWDVGSFLRFRAILRRSGIDIVHTHSHMAAYFVRIARALGGSRWVHVLHEHFPLIAQSRLRWVDRLCLSRVDYCFAASPQLTDYARRWVGIRPDRCETLTNGTDARVVAVRPKPDAFTVVQVGRVAPQKDQLIALAVAARLRDELPSLRWLVVGEADSAYGRRCRETARAIGLDGVVRFVGERADVHEILAGAHVGVSTSRAEAAGPLALLEYMAAGLPVVMMSAGDADELVRASGGGRVVRPGDVEGFVEALRAYVADPPAAARAGATNRRYVHRNHGVQAMVSRVAEVYADLLATGGVERALR